MNNRFEVIDRLPARSDNQPSIQPQLPTAAYVHIPFCRRRCYYCDFPVSVVGDKPPVSGSTTFGTIAQYVDALCQEIRATPAGGAPLQTVFFGGGTPSLLSVAQVQQILSALEQQFKIAADAEVSLEIDPGTFDRSQLQGYCAAGVNRVSLGVQSFDARVLAACGRTHTPADIYSAIDLIRQVGLTNFSLDLISGLPHLTLAAWERSLDAAIDLSPPHLSVYDLIVEPMTAFGRWYQPGAQPLPSEETTAQMYRLAQQRLTAAGYEHYEISNYAKPTYQCLHNRVYWENRAYYGFGMGAASYVENQRFTRPRKRSEYFEWVKALTAAGGRLDCEPTPEAEMLLDTLMLGLRLADGLSLQTLIDRFGEPRIQRLLTCLEPDVQQGWVAVLDDQGQTVPVTEAQSIAATAAPARLRLTDPEGFLFSNVVLTRVFEQLSP